MRTGWTHDADDHSISARFELRLLGGFEVREDGFLLPVPIGSQRVVAFLAVHGRMLRRPYVAGSLWPDGSDRRANGNLRSALWRLHEVRPIVVEAQGGLGLRHGLLVDQVRIAEAVTHVGALDPAAIEPLLRLLEDELLPDWDEDWVAEWRERWHHSRVSTLELLAGHLVDAGHPSLAISAALAAVRAEPFRESAHRMAIEAYLAEGDTGAAFHHFDDYRRLMSDELGVDVSASLRDLMAEATRPVTTR